MPRKYIKIRQLQARLPFKECFVQFVVRRLERDPLPTSQIEFYAKSISYSLDENIELLYSEKHLNSLGIYLMAINPDNRVASIGFVPLKLMENCIDRKERLQGVNEQVGSIIFSMQDQPFPRMSQLAKFKIDSSNSAHSNEDIGKENVRERLELKRSELSEEDLEEEMKEQKKGLFQSRPASEENLKIPKEDSPLSANPDQQAPINPNSHATHTFQSNKVSSEVLIAKSEVADQIGLLDQPQVQEDSPIDPYHSEKEELQSFIIELLKHKLHNREYFQTIQKNQTFLEQQRRILGQIMQQRIK